MKNIFFSLKNLDKDTYKIMKYGILFCSFISLISIIILFTYLTLKTLFFYELGLTLLTLSFYFAIDFIICGIVVDFIRKTSI